MKVAIGQDSHKLNYNTKKRFILGGVEFDEDCSLEGNSDADVVLHAITNAVSGITCKNILYSKDFRDKRKLCWNNSNIR